MKASTKKFQLNAKAIRTALKVEGVKVLSCKRGTGSAKKATYIVVDVKDAEKAVSFLANIGVINCLGKQISIMGNITRTEGAYTLGACYMDEQTYNELNG